MIPIRIGSSIYGDHSNIPLGTFFRYKLNDFMWKESVNKWKPIIFTFHNLYWEEISYCERSIHLKIRKDLLEFTSIEHDIWDVSIFLQ